jgi:UDP-N-acetylmuramoylalanine--D-glutamate ligase
MSIDAFPFTGYPIAVFGLGRSGLAAAKALHEADAEVWAWDDDEGARARAKDAGVPLVDLYMADWSQHTTLVVSPGVPLHHPKPHPIVTLARNAGCEVIGDIELLARCQRDCAYIGVTGTNGKSTTTALIGHILQTAGREAEIGGNIGVPAMDLESMGPEGAYVLEMSSYQLDLTLSITFDVAVLLNISNDHLDRHGGLDGYIKAKRQIFHRQTKPRTAVVGVDDAHSRAVYDDLKKTGDQVVVPISGQGPAAGGVYVSAGTLFDDTEGSNTPIMNLGVVKTLTGTHNAQNAAAAYAACRAAGLGAPVIAACINSYPGLVHRQERVDIVDGVLYVNDSKATNADAAARALASYQDIYWIAGGRPKDGGLEPVLDSLSSVRHAFLIGEAAAAFGQALDGRAPYTVSGDLQTALDQARVMAAADRVEKGLAEPVVLLSPACASFDQFSDFEARGDAFRDLVEALPGEHVDPFDDEIDSIAPRLDDPEPDPSDDTGDDDDPAGGSFRP